jgi:hypothetical protein
LDPKLKKIDEPIDWSAAEEIAAAWAEMNKKNVRIELRVDYVERNDQWDCDQEQFIEKEDKRRGHNVDLDGNVEIIDAPPARRAVALADDAVVSNRRASRVTKRPANTPTTIMQNEMEQDQDEHPSFIPKLIRE